jgi:hypothetical protein
MNFAGSVKLKAANEIVAAMASSATVTPVSSRSP